MITALRAIGKQPFCLLLSLWLRDNARFLQMLPYAAGQQMFSWAVSAGSSISKLGISEMQRGHLWVRNARAVPGRLREETLFARKKCANTYITQML